MVAVASVSRLMSVVCVLFMASMSFAANPYSICGGYSNFEKVNMPEECEVYDWNNLEPRNMYNMIRPYTYWESKGIYYQYWGYDPVQDKMGRNDAERTQFANWIQANPGKIYLLGNEPNWSSQDNLTPTNYAKMFKTCRDFISQYDATAKFAIAGYDIQYPGRPWDETRDDINAVLTAYKSQNANQPMPIDHWTMHLYIRTSDVNATTAIGQYDALANWMRTVDGGRYAACPINLTEFGVNGAATTESVMVNYMTAFCSLLEDRVRAGQLNRFFWFTCDYFDDGGKWSKNCLLKADNTPSTLGITYRQLAENWQEPASVEDWNTR